MEAASSGCSSTTVDTKQQILEVARHLFSDRTYLGVSMSDIATSLGITKAALYYHFSGKRDIYLNVLEDVLADLRARLSDDSEETVDQRLRGMVAHYLEFGTREKNLVNALVARLSPGESDLRQFVVSFREEIVGLYQPAIERVIAGRDRLQGIDGRLLTTMLTAMMDGLILEHSILESALDPEKVSAQIVAILGLSGECSPCM
jgi:AcrR family transcriptional regulator